MQDSIKLIKLTDSSIPVLYTEGIHPIPNGNLIRIPTVVYQIMADMAAPNTQPKVLKFLQDWVLETYPGMELNAFIDLSNRDVQKLEAKGIRGFTWGMYIQLRRAGELNVTPLLDTITKLLT